MPHQTTRTTPDFALPGEAGFSVSTVRGTPGQGKGSVANAAAVALVAAAAAAGRTASSPGASSSDNSDAERATGSASTGGAGGDSGQSEEKVSAHQASANEAKGKGYKFWSISFLQRTCSHRGIPRMSQEKSKDVLARMLTDKDAAEKRASPFIDDLQAVVDGEVKVVVSSCCCCYSSSAYSSSARQSLPEFESCVLGGGEQTGVCGM